LGLALVAFLAASAYLSSAGAASNLAPQVNREGNVEVKVTPRTLAADAAVWEFEVTFSTHSVTLTGDPAQFSVLVDSRGNTHPALKWKGDPAGSHHRKGSLQFKPLAGDAAVELRISGVAGVASRSFRWQRQ
jgi:hypothetical protein